MAPINLDRYWERDPSILSTSIIASGWHSFWCDVRDLIDFFPCVEPVPPIEYAFVGNDYGSSTVSVSSSVAVSTTTIVQYITNEYHAAPVEREIIREVTIRDNAIDTSRFVTRVEYDRQIDAIMRSIEHSSTGGNSGGGGGSVASLGDIGDVVVMSQAAGDLLIWDGSAWTSIATSSLGIDDWVTAGSDIYYGTGNVGIGTSSPTTLLYVGRSDLSDQNVLTLRDVNGTCVNNPTTSGTGWACSSDERLKKNIVDTAVSGLDYINSFRIRDYDLRVDNSHYTGIVAQEILPLHPELVSQDSDGFYLVAQPNNWIMVKALQELDLSLDLLVSATATSTPEAENFVTAFFDRLRDWFADTANGIGTMVANVFEANEMICVDGECLTADDIRDIKDRINEDEYEEPIEEETPVETPPENPGDDLPPEEPVEGEENDDIPPTGEDQETEDDEPAEVIQDETGVVATP